MFSVHYHIVPFPVAACQHTEMDAEYALSEADWRIVFQTLPQREMVVCVRPSEMSRQRAEGGIDVSSDQHPVHVNDVVGGQDDVQDFHESHLREAVCREDRSEKIDVHKRCLLIVIVIEYLETGNARVEIVA